MILPQHIGVSEIHGINRTPQTPRSAFTLVELLTVLAIVGILAAIMIPVIGSVRASARDAECKSNLRQLHVAVLLYAQNNQDELPPAYDDAANVTWSSALLAGDYLPRVRVAANDSRNQVLGCPLQQAQINDPLARTYGFNLHIGTKNPRTKLRTLQHPARALLIADGSYTPAANPPYNVALFATGAKMLPSSTHPDNTGKVNCLFVDGHVESRANTNIDDGIPTGLGGPGSVRYAFWTGQ